MLHVGVPGQLSSLIQQAKTDTDQRRLCKVTEGRLSDILTLVSHFTVGVE